MRLDSLRVLSRGGAGSISKMSAFIQPFDLETLYVNTLSGSYIIFSILFILAIASLCAKFKMNNLTTGIILLLGGVIMTAWMPWIAVLAAVTAGFLLYGILGRIIKT